MITYKLTMPDCDANMKIAIKAYRASFSRPVLFRRTIDRLGKPCIELTLTDKEACLEAIKRGFTGSLDIEDVPTMRTWIGRNDESRIDPAGIDLRSQLEKHEDAPVKVTLDGLLELIRTDGVQKTSEDIAEGRYEIVIEGVDSVLLTAKQASDILECVASVQSAEARCSILKRMIL